MDGKFNQFNYFLSFDMVHFGHANLVRQVSFISHGIHLFRLKSLVNTSLLGFTVTVSFNNDFKPFLDEIARHKGPPVFSQEERLTLLKAIKWVDEVRFSLGFHADSLQIVTDAPYMTQLDVLEEYACEFCVHGGMFLDSEVIFK